MVPIVPTRSAAADKLLLLLTVDAVGQETEARTHLNVRTRHSGIRGADL
jgi:hypothetical protein